VSKIVVVAVLLVAGLGYLAFDPTAARDAANWVRRQVGSTPKVRDVGAPNYTPVLPSKGL
jgi:hypothetical protein